MNPGVSGIEDILKYTPYFASELLLLTNAGFSVYFYSVKHTYTQQYKRPPLFFTNATITKINSQPLLFVRLGG